MTTDATFLLLGGGKIEHSIFHFFVFLTFAAAKVQQICDIRKRFGEKKCGGRRAQHMYPT